MKISFVIEILLALFLYGVVFAALAWVGSDVIAGIIDSDVKHAEIAEHFTQYAYILLGASLVCFLLWFTFAAGVIHPTAPGGRWLLVWFLLLFVVLVAAGVVTWLLQQDFVELQDPYDPWRVGGLYFGAGVILYYVASVVCSPLRARYRIPPAKILHR